MAQLSQRVQQPIGSFFFNIPIAHPTTAIVLDLPGICAPSVKEMKLVSRAALSRAALTHSHRFSPRSRFLLESVRFSRFYTLFSLRKWLTVMRLDFLCIFRADSRSSPRRTTPRTLPHQAQSQMRIVIHRVEALQLNVAVVVVAGLPNPVVAVQQRAVVVLEPQSIGSVARIRKKREAALWVARNQLRLHESAKLFMSTILSPLRYVVYSVILGWYRHTDHTLGLFNQNLSALLHVRTVDILKELIKLNLCPRHSEDILERDVVDMLCVRFASPFELSSVCSHIHHAGNFRQNPQSRQAIAAGPSTTAAT